MKFSRLRAHAVFTLAYVYATDEMVSVAFVMTDAGLPQSRTRGVLSGDEDDARRVR